jgi:hypothetical protein
VAELTFEPGTSRICSRNATHYIATLACDVVTHLLELDSSISEPKLNGFAAVCQLNYVVTYIPHLFAGGCLS